MDTLKYHQKVDENHILTIELPESYREQEVEVIVMRKEPPQLKPELTQEEKLEILRRHRGSFPKWTPDVDLEEEWYNQ